MKKGEVWVINSERSGGHEQSGVRPAVIVSDITARIVMVVPFTSNTRSLRFARTIQFEPNASNNLSVTSIAMVYQLRGIDVKRLVKKVGVLTAGEVKLLDEEIRKMLKV